ncbi:protein of unknown function DUF4604 [Fusarium oxysporum f. sp. vasinfectum]|nr:protein of unknown function DUF4604 [Fusarium oxysporum f. sp. vasinfectum]
MAPKINSKNLSYDTEAAAPPFLAALRAQAAGATGPDPLLAAQRRSAKKRSSSEEAEDVPLVVDEDGNVVSLEVDKDGVVKDTGDYDVEPAAEKETAKESESKAAIGGRKRKVGKVIAGIRCYHTTLISSIDQMRAQTPTISGLEVRK